MSTLSGFKSSFYCSHQRSPTEQEIFNEGVREGACRIVEMRNELKPIVLTDDEKTKILDWVSACQSAYHTDNTPGSWFGGLGSNLDENRTALIECVGSIIESRSQTAPQHSANIDAMRPVIDLLKRARYVRHGDLSPEEQVLAETRTAYGNHSAWADARSSEQLRLINEAIALLEERAAIDAALQAKGVAE